MSKYYKILCALALTLLPVSSFGAIERANLTGGGGEADAYSTTISISENGEYVAFFSTASNLVAGDTNGVGDVFVKNRNTGDIERVTLSSAGVQQNKSINTRVSISDDGRYVAFMSSATNLVAGDTNGKIDVFVRDRQTNTTERVSVATDGTQGNKDDVAGLGISDDGRYVAFNSRSSNLVTGDTNAGSPNGGNDTFVRDRQLGTTERVSIADNEAESNGDNITGYNVTISSDGRYVTFASDGTNLVAGDTNSATDIFLRDRTLGTTEMVSVADDESIGNGAIQYGVAMSADGQLVAFSSSATNLVAGDTNGEIDVFVRDRSTSSTRRVVAYDSSEANDSVKIGNLALSPDGGYLGFLSAATNLVAGDTNGVADAFVEY